MLVQMAAFSRRGVIHALTAAVLCAIAGHGAFRQSDPLPRGTTRGEKLYYRLRRARTRRVGGLRKARGTHRHLRQRRYPMGRQPIYFQLVFALDRAKATASAIRNKEEGRFQGAASSTRRSTRAREGMDHRRHEAGLEDHLSIRKVAGGNDVDSPRLFFATWETPAGDCCITALAARRSRRVQASPLPNGSLSRAGGVTKKRARCRLQSHSRALDAAASSWAARRWQPPARLALGAAATAQRASPPALAHPVHRGYAGGGSGRPNHRRCLRLPARPHAGDPARNHTDRKEPASPTTRSNTTARPRLILSIRIWMSPISKPGSPWTTGPR